MNLKSRHSKNLGGLGKVLRSLRPMLKPYRLVMVISVSTLLIVSAMQLALPLAIRHLIDRGLTPGNLEQLNRYFVTFLGIAILLGFFSAVRLYSTTWLSERLVADLRTKVYQAIIRMDMTFFESTKIGEMLSRSSNDMMSVQVGMGASGPAAVLSVILLIGAIIGMALTSAKLTWMILIVLVVVVIPTMLLGRHVRRLSRAALDRLAQSSGLAGESFLAIQTVQAFTLEEHLGRSYSKAVADAFDATMHRSRAQGLLMTLSSVLIAGGMSTVLWIGARDLVDKTMSVGQLGQFALFATIAGSSAMALSGIWAQMQRAAGAAERILELAEARPLATPPTSRRTLPTITTGSIRFDNVSFAYPSRAENPAISELTLSIHPGEKVVLVGASGAGKSTIINLLLKFYVPTSGSIFIDETDIADTDPQAIRRRIGLVAQQPELFNTTVRENIRLGRADATDVEVEAAAISAAADEFIRKLPQQYDTLVGERGLRLSGGQLQRLAIARALLRDPPILLLDEATNSLDSGTEHLVQNALDSAMRGRTAIVIAHHLHTVQQADRIVVLDAGRIVATGPHGELLKTSGHYAQLAARKFNQNTIT